MTSSFAKNFSLLTANSILAPVFSMTLVLAISRTQGAELLGKYSFLMTVFLLGQTCTTMGLTVIITREVARARNRASRYFFNASLLAITVIAFVLALAVPVLQRMLTNNDLCRALIFILFALLPSALMLYGQAVLLGFEHAADFVAVDLAENLTKAVTGTFLVVTGYGIVALAVAILSMRVLATTALLIMLHRRGVSMRPHVDRQLCRSLFGQVPVVGAISVVNMVYTRADIFLLSWFGTWADVGVYSAARRLVDLARTVPQAYANALYPILSRLRCTASEDYRGVAFRSVRDVLLLGTPAVVFLSGLAPTLVPMIYGPDLALAANSLKLLAWTLPPMAVAMTLAQVLFSADHQAVDLRVNVTSTIVNITANLILIPAWGYMGATVAAVLSAGLYATLQYMGVRKHVADPQSVGQIVPILAVALVSWGLVLAIGNTNPFLAGMTGAGAFVGGLVITRIVTHDDWNRLVFALSASAPRLRQVVRW